MRESGMPTTENDMSAIFELDQFNTLPLTGQALIAMRMVRRGVMAIVPAGDGEYTLIMRICDAIESCAKDGYGVRRIKSLLDEGRALRDVGGPHGKEREFLRHSVWWAIDAILAAEMAQDFPMDETVTQSALTSMKMLANDRRINRLQITIMFAGDFDLVRFACGESGVGRHEGIGSYVLERLPPVHALSLNEVRPTPEELAR